MLIWKNEHWALLLYLEWIVVGVFTEWFWDICFSQTFELGLAPIAVLLRKDVKLAEEFLESLPSDFPSGQLEELRTSHQNLQTTFSSLSSVSSERMKHVMLAIDSEMVGIEAFHAKSEFEF